MSSSSFVALKEILRAQAPALQAQFRELRKGDAATRIIGSVTVGKIVDGSRVPSVFCVTSRVDPDDGLLIRDKPISSFVGSTPEQMIWFLLTGTYPSAEQLSGFSAEMANTADELIDQLYTDDEECFWILNAFASHHPMDQIGVQLFHLSRFLEQGQNGADWEVTLDDYLKVISVLPTMANGQLKLHHPNS